MSSAVRIERTGSPLASDVRTARSLWARFRGLMGRRSLAPGEGLWLPTDASIHMLFMRFAIDAVFLAPTEAAPAEAAPAEAGSAPPADPPAPAASSGTPRAPGAAAPSIAGVFRRGRPEPTTWRVVAIRERLRPWLGVVWFVRGARGCLELEAGAATRAGLRVGDVVRFEPGA